MRSVYGRPTRSYAGGHERSATGFKSGGNPSKSISFPLLFLFKPGLEVGLATDCMGGKGLAAR